MAIPKFDEVVSKKSDKKATPSKKRIPSFDAAESTPSVIDMLNRMKADNQLPATVTPEEGGLTSGLQKFNAVSDAFLDPFQKAATFGLSGLVNKGLDNLGMNDASKLKEENEKTISPTTKKVGEIAGSLIGYAQPTQLAYKTLGKAGAAGLSKIAPNAGKFTTEAVRGASAGLGVGALSGAIEGDGLKDVGKGALIGAAGGAILDPAFMKLGQVAGGLLKRTPKPASTIGDTTTKIVSGNKKESGIGLWERLNRVYSRVVDTQRPISRFTNDAKMDTSLNPRVLASNARNSQGITGQIFETGLVNKEGQQIGEGYKALLSSVPKNTEEDFSKYLLYKHNVARMGQEKPVFSDMSAEASTAKVTEYESLHPEFKELGGRVNNFIDNFMKTWGVDSGLLKPEQYAAMKQMYPDYVPTYREFSELEKGLNLFGKKGKAITGQTAGIKKATGSDRPVIDPLESIMGLVDKTVKAAKYNEAGQSIVAAIKENPDKLKRWAEIVPSKEGLMDDINKVLREDGIEGVVEKLTQQFDSAFNKTSLDKDNIVRIMIEGNPVYLKINDKSFLDAIKGLTNSDAGAIEKAFRKGTGIFKALITGKNPFFAIRNIARDIPVAYINGSEKNPVKFLLGIIDSGKDILTKNKSYKEYKGLGGGKANFFNQDPSLLKNGNNILKGLVDKVEGFNNFTESVPRYAEYKRTVKRGGGDYASKQQGLFNANEVTVNFSRNGDITKSADAFVPYLNPAVQGLDKLVRQFIKHPIATVLKGATAITAPTLMLDHVNKDDPAYKALDSRTKDNYYLIPKGDGTFFKLPKSRELGVLFGSLTERILRKKAGEQNSFKGFGSTVATNFAPTNPLESNIASPLMTNIGKNKDFADRTIVPEYMQDRSPRYQYDDQTSEIARAIGSTANLSPKQIDYLIKAYTGVVGQLLLPATTKTNYMGSNSIQKVTKPITTQFKADPLYSNQTVTDFYDNYDKLKRMAADRNFVESIPSKAVTPEENAKNAFAKASKEMSDISKQIKEVEKTGDIAEIKQLRQNIISIAKSYNEMLDGSQLKLK